MAKKRNTRSAKKMAAANRKGVPSKRAKVIKKTRIKKPGRATARSTGGAGFDFEDQVGAGLLLSMLLGEMLPGLGDEAVGQRLQSQTESLKWVIDDLLATGTSDRGQHQLAISCKSNQQVSGSGLPAEFVAAAWQQWTAPDDNPFNRKFDGLMLVTRGLNAQFRRLWTDVKRECGDDPAVTVARLTSTAVHARFFNRIRDVVRQAQADAADAEIVEFISHLHVWQTDYQQDNSQFRRENIARCRGILKDGSARKAAEVWSDLVGLVSKARLGHGTITIEQVWAALRRKYNLKDHPEYGAAWRILDDLTVAHRKRIETKLPSGLSLPRQAEVDSLATLISSESVVVVFGDSGSGKSALIKEALDSRLGTLKQVWLGPQEFADVSSPARRLVYGMLHPLADTLKAATSSQNILILDAAERLDADAQAAARELVGELLEHNGENDIWKIIVVGQTDGWDDRRLQRMANMPAPKGLKVGALSTSEVKQALQSVPRLAWAVTHDRIVGTLGNLRALAWALESAAGFAKDDVAALSSQIAIAEHVWKYWTEGKPSHEGFLMRLAVREAEFEHRFGISEFSVAEGQILETAKRLPLRRVGNHIEFQHDLASDWARFQKLNEMASRPCEWARHATNPLWIGALRMLGSSLLCESVGGKSAWDTAFETLVSDESTAAAADLLLDALALDPLAPTLLAERAELLFKDGGKLLVRLLKRFLHVATAPGGASQEMAEVLFAEPSYAVYIEAQYRTPDIPRWPAIAGFLASNKDRVATLMNPVVAQVCEKWLSSLPTHYKGNPLPFRREFAEVAIATARVLQLEQLKHTMIIGDFRATIYSAAMAAAPDLPDDVSEWALEMVRRRPVRRDLTQKASEHFAAERKKHQEQLVSDEKYRERHERKMQAASASIPRRRLPHWPLGPQGDVDHHFQEFCGGPTGLVPLMKVRPEIAAEVLIAVLIEDSPEDDYGSSSRMDESLGLVPDRSDGTGFWKSPFFTFLRINPKVALAAFVKLANFCTDRWLAEYQRVFDDRPSARLLLCDGTEREFIGGWRVFEWYQTSTIFAGQIHSAFSALERWLCAEIEEGKDVAPVLERIMKECNSTALLGVLTSVGKFSPRLLQGILKPLTLIPQSYRWDDTRADQLGANFNAFQVIRQGNLIFKMAQDWHFAPHHRMSLVAAVVSLIKADSALAQDVREATAQWNHPTDQKRAIEQRMLAAQLDVSNYSGPDNAQFSYPEDLRREMEAFQGANASAQFIVTLPDQCRQALQHPANLTDESAGVLAKVVYDSETDTGLEEEFTIKGKIVAACTLLLKAEDWLRQHPEIASEANKIVNDALTDSEEGISRRILDRDEFQFVAYVVFKKWLNTPDAASGEAVLRAMTSDSAIAVRTLFALAHGHRDKLGSRWWRLLRMSLLWAGLAILRPRVDEGSDDIARWSRWRERLRKFSLQAEASSAQFDPLYIAQRIEKIERSRWHRETDPWLKSREPVSAGLEWDFLTDAYGWLQIGEEPVSAADFDERKLIALALWKFEVWHIYREPREPRERDEPLPDRLGYKLAENFAKMVAHADVTKAQELWLPVFELGPYGHYAIEQFLRHWFSEVSHLEPEAFNTRWRPMVDYVMGRTDWTSGKGWYHGRKLQYVVLGFQNTTQLDRRSEFQKFALEARGFYEVWAKRHLWDEDSLARFASFLSSSYAKLLRLDGLSWISASLKGEKQSDRWYRAETGAALLDFLNVLLNEDVELLRTDSTARDTFLDLVGVLVARQVEAALALQERARRMLLARGTGA